MKIKTITCPICNVTYDRDINAAINIDNEGLRIALLQLNSKAGTA
jgi:transposase